MNQIKKIFTTLSLFLFAVTVAKTQLQHVVLLNEKVFQYEKAEWTVQLTAEWKNPYLQEDIALDMLLTSPSGKELVLPCYFESGESDKPSLWKARFTPQETGHYTGSFQLTQKGLVTGTAPIVAFTVETSGKKGFLHPKNNWELAFDNGTPFRGIGENICWESRDNDDSKYFKALHENPKYNYEYMLPSLAKHGGNFYRTWICPWNLPIDWKKGFNSRRYTSSDAYYNPSAVKALDRLVTLSDSLGLYIMLTLGPGAYETRNGEYAASAADFFVNPLSKAMYKNRLRYLVARWGYSISIGVWEFFNEVDNVQFSNRKAPISAESITQWHDEMSTYLKSIDLYHHVVSTSISHRDIKGLNSLPNIDINQKHIYKNTAIIPATLVKYEQDYQKPYVIGEYGYEYDWQKDFNLFSGEMDSDYKRGMWYGLFSPTPILPMSWWWEYFDDRGTDAYLSRIKTMAGWMMEAGNGMFEKTDVKVPDTSLTTMAVTCGNKIFVYVYNTANTNQKTSVKVSSKQPASGSSYKVYDCASGTYSGHKKIKLSGGYLDIKNLKLGAKTDVVLIIDTTVK